MVVDGGPVPERLVARARRRVDVAAGPLASATVAELRPDIPRSIGVVGAPAAAAEVARQLHRSGLPVTVYSDLPVDVEAGIEVDRISDTGPPIDAADSLLDLIGHTPLVRMDRIGATCPGSCSPSWSSSTPAAASRTDPPWPWWKPPSGTAC